jgi:hypothetical protein
VKTGLLAFDRDNPEYMVLFWSGIKKGTVCTGP